METSGRKVSLKVSFHAGKEAAEPDVWIGCIDKICNNPIRNGLLLLKDCGFQS